MPASRETDITPSVNQQTVGVPEDLDPAETQEWIESLEAMIHHLGPARAGYVLKQLEARAQELGVAAHAPLDRKSVV